MILRKFLGVLAFSVIAASAVIVPKASAHHGSASGECRNGEGVITAEFVSFGSHFGDITVHVNDQLVDTFDRDGTFTREYKPYANGTYWVRAQWAFDHNGNGQVDGQETTGFSETVRISGCETPVEMCPISGKENLPKNDPNCKEDPMCPIDGKTHLPKNDPGCKEDEVNCEVPGKTDLPVGDPECKEDELPKEIPNTGASAGTMIAALSAVAVLGAAAHNAVLRRN